MSLQAVLAEMSSASAEDMAVADCFLEVCPKRNQVFGPVMMRFALDVERNVGRKPAKSASVYIDNVHALGSSPMWPYKARSRVPRTYENKRCAALSQPLFQWVNRLESKAMHLLRFHLATLAQ